MLWGVIKSSNPMLRKTITFLGWAVLLSSTAVSSFSQNATTSQRINRQALVERHIVQVHRVDTLSSLSVGNGKFAFTVDATGLQTFPVQYANGVPLGTQSEWGWHSNPNTEAYRFDETLRSYQLNGRSVPYSVQINNPARNKEAVNYYRVNPHRLQLGQVGFLLLHKNGKEATPNELTQINQTLNPWTGIIESHFVFDNEPVEVKTLSGQQQDVIAVEVHSALLQKGQLKCQIRLPYPSNAFLDAGVNYQQTDKHQSVLVDAYTIKHQLDATQYFIKLGYDAGTQISAKAPHEFVISPKQASLHLQVLFTPNVQEKIPTFAHIFASNQQAWRKFWQNGGIIDFAGSTDARAKELERRMVLSLYLTKIQCTGSQPPQETGLTYNSWFGKPHLEMHWWHGIHFALWGRAELLEKSLTWYAKVYDEAEKIAKRQGYEGVRWQKMTDPAGEESPSSVGAFLIWQQPHFIYFAELLRRQKPTKAVLDKYKKLVFATADFMASYPTWDEAQQRYILGKGLIPAQERFNPEETYNPTYELVYWHWALQIAQQWRKALGMKASEKYQRVLDKLSALPIQEGVYLATESAKDSYTNPKFLTDHPSVLGAYGMLPLTPKLDVSIMQKTFDKVWKDWQWNDTWGWDFPMVAMTAARLNNPEKAIEGLLMPIKTNTYLPNGHNFQDERLRIYLPGNGGILAALAMMCQRDGLPQGQHSFPQNGRWKVRWEGLKPMP